MDTLTGADITIDTLVIPTSVNTIGVYALAHHTDLVSVTIPNSVTAIGTSAFADCYSLSPVTIPNNVASIASNAFTDVTMIYYQGSVGGSFGARCRNGYEENGLYYTNSSKQGCHCRQHTIVGADNQSKSILQPQTTRNGYYPFIGRDDTK